MSKIFDLDSPFMRALNTVADVMIINLLTVVCSIPIFTVGASLSAMHYTILKLKRDEGSYITREFFKAFKVNFKQGTLIWLFILFCAFVLGLDYYIIYTGSVEVPQFVGIAVLAISILLLTTMLWVFPLQSKFINKASRTFKNAFALSIAKFPRTVVMALLNLLPWVLAYFSWQAFPIVIMFGLAGPAYGSACMYDKVFKGLEEKIMERMQEEEGGDAQESEPDEEEKIFSDKLMIGDEDDH